MSETRRHDDTGWQRWNMGDLKSHPPPASSTPSDPAALREQQHRQAERQRQAQLDQERRQAREEGRKAGHAEGHEAGYAQGLEEGRAAGKQEWESQRRELVRPLQDLMQGLHQALDTLDADIGDALTDVALAAAKRLAGNALDAKPEHVLTLIRDLLREEPLFTGQPRLWLHPDDMALIDGPLMEELQATGWKLQPDSELERGGCRITGPEGELNATREARWQALLARARRYGSAPIRHTPNSPDHGDTT